MSAESSTSAATENHFDLQAFAAQVTTTVPSYEELVRDARPRFLEFLHGKSQLSTTSARNDFRRQALQKKAEGKKVFVVLGTGGTFQSNETDAGLAPTGSLRESFDALGMPEDPSVFLALCDLMKLDSSQMTVEHWRFLAEMLIELEREAGDAFDGVIITHGTDTMARGAAYLSFMLKGFPTSIIFTGSQEPARKTGTDAKDHMERSISVAKLASNPARRITEVMVCCGQRVTRGTWAQKLGDKTVNAFGPWNQPSQGFDAVDWDRAVRDGILHKLAPALVDFGNGKSRGSTEFAGHAITYAHKGRFDPFTAITTSSDILPVTLTGLSRETLARHIASQRISMLKILGSATAPDDLVEVALAAADHGKIVCFTAPFHDSSVRTGTYSAGKKMGEKVPTLQRSLPLINTSPETLGVKAHFVMERLGIKEAKLSDRLGHCYTSADIRKFYDAMEENMVGELV